MGSRRSTRSCLKGSSGDLSEAKDLLLLLEQSQLAGSDQHRLLHGAFRFLERGGLAGMTARLPAVDPVPFLLRPDPDLPHPLFAEPASVREVAPFPERLSRLSPAFRHSLPSSRHSTRVSTHEK